LITDSGSNLVKSFALTNELENSDGESNMDDPDECHEDEPSMEDDPRW